MTWLSSWAPYFKSDQRVAGRACYIEARVDITEPEVGELFRAQINDEEQQLIVHFDKQGPNTTAHCSCSQFKTGEYCQHIWAALLAMEESGSSIQLDNPAVDTNSPKPPRARKRTGKRKPSRPVEPSWVGRLSLIRPESFARPNTPQSLLPTLRQICYVIDVDLSTRHHGLVVAVHHRSPTRNGWSSLKPLRINHDLLSDIANPIDRELLGQLIGANRVDKHEMGERFVTSDRLHSVFRAAVGTWRSTLQRMIDTGRCYVDLHPDRPSVQPQLLKWDYATGDDPAEPWQLWLKGTLDNENLRVTVQLRRNEQIIPVDQPALLLGGGDGLLIDQNKASFFDDCNAFRWARQFRDDFRLDDEEPDILVPRDDIARFLDRLYLLPSLPNIDLPEDIRRPEKQIEPIFNIEIFSPAVETKSNNSSRQTLTASLWFDYHGHHIDPQHHGLYAQTDADGSLILRNLDLEGQAMELLVRLGFRHNPNNDDDQLTLSARLLQQAVNELIARKWVVTADRRLIRTPSPPKLSVSSGIDWFELRGSVTYVTESGQQQVSLPDILAAARSGKAMIQLDDGSEGMLPEQWLSDHGLLASIADIEDDHLRFKQSQTALLDALLRQQDEVDFDEKFAAARERLMKFDGVDPIEPTGNFHGQLRPYQKDGLGWMKFQRWFGMGGILADDMGLGKTIQVLAMFDARYREGKIFDDIADDEEQKNNIAEHQPSLIVVPRSVVYNWVDEAKRFTPHLRVLSYTGPDRQPLRDAFNQYDLIITSYGLMRRDITELSTFTFDHVILDEAQAIKNPNSQAAKSARLLNTAHRLALTGTPVENHLGDLWSIFEFLNPGMLGSSSRFAQLVRSNASVANGNGNGNGNASDKQNNPEQTNDNSSVEKASYASNRLKKHTRAAVHIAKALRPFILRRTKKQVLNDLPDKTEQTLLCEMDDQQRAIYDELRNHYRNSLLKKIDRRATGVGGNAMMVLEALLRLRQAACHPGLINPEYENHASAKLDTLMDNVSELIDEGHKALIFSQFTSMLALVRKRFDREKITYEYLDGQTRNRKQRVERFQEDPDCPLFLISLRAGGLGLNLTAADYVFILDPWWNPAVESQAIDRAHRIGQTQHVFAYRLICENTVEQRIADLQDKKRQLADAIVGEQENILRSLTRDDLEMLLS